jgi:hypothetical protein
VDEGTGYYPIEPGNTWIFQVDTVAYTFAGDTLPGRYFIKEVLGDTLYFQEGRPVFRLEIYRTADTARGWVIDSVWSIRKDPDKIIRTENNRPYVVLKFPLREGSRWDGNQFNTLQDSNSVFWYTAQNLGQSYGFGNDFFPGVEVIQKIDSNCINNSTFREIYLKNIGPVYRKKAFLQYVQQGGSDPCGEIPVIEIGYSRTYSLLRFGKNL